MRMSNVNIVMNAGVMLTCLFTFPIVGLIIAGVPGLGIGLIIGILGANGPASALIKADKEQKEKEAMKNKGL